MVSDKSRVATDSTWQDSIVPPRTPSMLGRVVIVSLLALMSGTATAMWIESEQGYPYLGTLDSVRTTLRAPQDGLVTEVTCQVGQDVVPAAPLCLIEDSALYERLLTATAQVQTLREELGQLQAQADLDIASRVKDVDEELFESRLASSTVIRDKYLAEMESMAWHDYLKSRTQLVTAGGSPEVFQNLLQAAQVPDDQYIAAMLRHGAAENSVEVLGAQLELYEQRLAALTEDRAALPAQVHKAVGVDLATQRLYQAEETLKELEAKTDCLSIAARGHGKICDVRVTAGDRVEAGETLLEMFDHDRQFVTAQIATDEIHHFAVGNVVRLQFPGGVQGKGRVVSIAPEATNAGETGTCPVTAVKIMPAGRLWPQTPMGTRVRVAL